MTCRLQTCQRSDQQHGSLAASQTIDRHKGRSRQADENERKQVMLCIPLWLPLATELLIR